MIPSFDFLPQNAEASSSALSLDASEPSDSLPPPPLSSGIRRVPLQPLGAADPQEEDDHDFTEEQVDEYREQDRFLPIANVSRIMKDCLPPSAKIAKESKECLQECVSEFISFITSEASERCKIEKRKTMNGEDILDAMSALGFDNYVEALKVYLAKYRMSQVNKPKRSSKSSKTASNEDVYDSSLNDDDDEAEEGDEEDEFAEGNGREAKRVRIE